MALPWTHSHSRTPVYDSTTDGPAEAGAAEALSDGPAAISPIRGHDMGVEVARRAFSHVPQRSRHALYASDGGSSVGSHGFDWESTPTMLLGEEKAEKSEENAPQTLQTQLGRFEEGVKSEDWKPVVMLVEDTATLRALAQYLTNNVGNGGGCEVGRELRADVAMEFVRGVAGGDEPMHQLGVFDLLREVDSRFVGWLNVQSERTRSRAAALLVLRERRVRLGPASLLRHARQREPQRVLQSPVPPSLFPPFLSFT